MVLEKSLNLILTNGQEPYGLVLWLGVWYTGCGKKSNPLSYFANF